MHWLVAALSLEGGLMCFFKGERETQEPVKSKQDDHHTVQKHMEKDPERPAE